MSTIKRKQPKKSIIKKRQKTFHIRKEKGITKKRIIAGLAAPAKWITKTAKDPKTRTAIGSFIKRLAEGGERFAEAQKKRK